MKARLAAALVINFWLSCIPAGYSQTLVFDDVLHKAVSASYDLKIANLDTRISTQAKREARAEYFPTLTSRLNTEYNRDVDDAVAPGVQSVGSNVLVNSTLFQGSASLQMNYNVLDFGARRHKLLYAQKDIDTKRTVEDKALRDLKQKVVELYTQALITSRELEARQSMLAIRQEMLVLRQRLYDAGQLSKVDLAEEAIQVAQNVTDVTTLKDKLKATLRELSTYTHESYEPQNTDFAPLKARVAVVDIQQVDYEKTPEYRLAQLEIEKKREELEVLKRQRLPVVSAYASYNLYGSNRDAYFSSLGDIKPRTATIGFATSLTLFDGFKHAAAKEKLGLELEKLETEQEKKLAEERNRLQKLADDQAAYRQESELKAMMATQAEEKLDMVSRLAAQQINSQTDLIEQRLQMMRQKLEADLAAIKKDAADLSLELLSEGLY